MTLSHRFPPQILIPETAVQAFLAVTVPLFQIDEGLNYMQGVVAIFCIVINITEENNMQNLFFRSKVVTFVPFLWLSL